MKSFHADTSPSVRYYTSFKHGGNNLAANLCILNLVKKIWSITVCMAYPFTGQHLSSTMQLWPEMCEKTLNIHHNQCHQLTLFNTCTHFAALQYHTPKPPTSLHSSAWHFCTFMYWRTIFT